MGRQQEKLAKQVQRKVEQLIEASLRNGSATPVQELPAALRFQLGDPLLQLLDLLRLRLVRVAIAPGLRLLFAQRRVAMPAGGG